MRTAPIGYGDGINLFSYVSNDPLGYALVVEAAAQVGRYGKKLGSKQGVGVKKREEKVSGTISEKRCQG